MDCSQAVIVDGAFRMAPEIMVPMIKKKVNIEMKCSVGVYQFPGTTKLVCKHTTSNPGTLEGFGNTICFLFWTWKPESKVPVV